MALRPSLQDFWKFPEIEITGGAFVMNAVWLLLLPIQWLGAAILAGTVHELGHLIWLWGVGSRVWRIQIGAFGAKIETEMLTPQQELGAALAGPAAGLVLCLYWGVLPRTAFCSLLQSIYNLIPLYPMDGGRALRAFQKILKEYRNKEKSVAKDRVSGYNDSD